jgi:hypothetical protein
MRLATEEELSYKTKSRAVRLLSLATSQIANPMEFGWDSVIKIYPSSKICFLYSFHNKEQTASVKNNEVMRAITVIISTNFSPSISTRNVPYMYLKIMKKKRINATKKKGVKHQNIIFAILFSLWI